MILDLAEKQIVLEHEKRTKEVEMGPENDME